MKWTLVRFTSLMHSPVDAAGALADNAFHGGEVFSIENDAFSMNFSQLFSAYSLSARAKEEGLIQSWRRRLTFFFLALDFG